MNNKKYASMLRIIVTAFTLSVGANGAVFGAVLMSGNEVNTQFNETSPTATPNVANGPSHLESPSPGSPVCFTPRA